MAPSSASQHAADDKNQNGDGDGDRVRERDFYAVLEVDCLAPLAAIRESYRRLALRWHPDKNRGSPERVEGATKRFQELGRAWECLRDDGRRREYDCERVRVGKASSTERWWEASRNSKRCRGDGEGAGGGWYDEFEKDEELGKRARRRRGDLDREASERWRTESAGASASASPFFSEEELQQKLFAEEVTRRAKAVAWKVLGKREYQLRLQSWMKFREQRFGKIQEVRKSLGRYERNLEAQEKETEDDVGKVFQDAIEKSREEGCEFQDHDAILARLLDAREKYSGRLRQSIAQHRQELENLYRELERDSQRYEEVEAKARRIRIREALELLGPRHLSPPLFCVLDRRGLAINHWKALSRIKEAARYPSMWDLAEGPWHVSGDWERVAGEHTCGRCQDRAFHVIASCGPARCPRCGMIVCNDCYRDLKLLQEYGEWMMSEEGEMQDSLFCLDADLSAGYGSGSGSGSGSV
ncbi:uncharacterized protein L3040_002920 [Drepanopeziza brunnea f. sp. 'multigermtubi']|uniref:J domain-containing protein n=1 Tax=Marssonina brunnea f. sp. multigermtubi (strain MB_m1) TaxID=1072389 RepID=K1W7P2_MARBU|nr:uncharacterized protein MBM_08563 [Drepanopeziza brunnea f. sp. 'multigermtubi' MB_m1]EKD13120.1 hypothetical protein MBM_08563 [Drepanopeziza brunnea f. sp. 'multigermtubi' MB_m1]KAJ5047077.1 hypothetical protein L3040_002920 [Drepanopeziza brunnea f. sp. 'multigermtubi']